MLAWQTTLLVHPAEIFDREQFRRADEIVIDYPKEFEITADAKTAAMIMTHNYGRDLAWLRGCDPRISARCRRASRL
jgi:xanthine/CO dehydrogenase XdhC/CoxF family maturation factor